MSSGIARGSEAWEGGDGRSDLVACGAEDCEDLLHAGGVCCGGLGRDSHDRDFVDSRFRT